MKYMYVTEPDAISSQAIKQVLAGTEYTAINGDTAFTNSGTHSFTAILIRSGTKIDASIAKHFPLLGHVIRVGVGLDNVDLAYCKKADIAVYNAPGANADAVSEYTVAMMLYALRNLNKLRNENASSWNRFAFIGHGMAKQTVGIVGFGHIGRLIYEKLRSFHCKGFYAYDPYLAQDVMPDGVRLVDLPTLLRNCSLVSLHLPLTAETTYIIDAKQLAMLRPGSILINASRGGIVREQAVLDMSKQQAITYIADAVENEPHVNPALLARDNIIITPHIASLTDSSEEAMVTTALTNFLQGKAVTS